MDNVAFDSLFRWKIIKLLIFTSSLIRVFKVRNQSIVTDDIHWSTEIRSLFLWNKNIFADIWNICARKPKTYHFKSTRKLVCVFCTVVDASGNMEAGQRWRMARDRSIPHPPGEKRKDSAGWGQGQALRRSVSNTTPPPPHSILQPKVYK